MSGPEPEPETRRVLVVAGNRAQYESYMLYADHSKWAQRPKYIIDAHSLRGLRAGAYVLHVVTGPGWQERLEVLEVARQRGIEVKHIDLDTLGREPIIEPRLVLTKQDYIAWLRDHPPHPDQFRELRINAPPPPNYAKAQGWLILLGDQEREYVRLLCERAVEIALSDERKKRG